MNSVERVKELCKDKGIALSKLEKDLGFANGYISQLRKGSFPADRLAKIAEYLGVSQGYLLTGEDDPENPVYYFSTETAEMAQELFENKGMRLLFDAARGSSQQTLKATADFLKAMKEEEGDAD